MMRNSYILMLIFVCVKVHMCSFQDVSVIINETTHDADLSSSMEKTTLPNIFDEEENADSNEESSLDDFDDSENDSEDAFDDFEDEEVLCEDYKSLPKEKKLPDAIIIGVRKGGTRALLEFINMNSKVRRAKPEIHFYDDNYDRGIDWYIKKMPAVTATQIALEKTPGYFHTKGVPNRVYKTAPYTKLILILRNPVDRMISDYNQLRTKNLDAGKTYPPIEKFLFTKEGSINIGYGPLQRSIYFVHLSRWMANFPLSQILVIDGDSFIKEPWTEMKKLETFLGVPNEIKEDNFFFNSTKGFFCGQEFLNMPGSDWTCSRRKCLNKSKGRPKAKVEDETYRRLTEFFSSHNKIFFSLLKRDDFNWPSEWKPKENETSTIKSTLDKEGT